MRFATLGGIQLVLLMFSAWQMWCSSASGFLGEKNNTARQQPPLCHEGAQEGDVERYETLTAMLLSSVSQRALGKCVSSHCWPQGGLGEREVSLSQPNSLLFSPSLKASCRSDGGEKSSGSSCLVLKGLRLGTRLTPGYCVPASVSELFLPFSTVRDRVRTKIERDILADVNHPFVVKLHYGECGASWDTGRRAAGSNRH